MWFVSKFQCILSFSRAKSLRELCQNFFLTVLSLAVWAGRPRAARIWSESYNRSPDGSADRPTGTKKSQWSGQGTLVRSIRCLRGTPYFGNCLMGRWILLINIYLVPHHLKIVGTFFQHHRPSLISQCLLAEKHYIITSLFAWSTSEKKVNLLSKLARTCIAWINLSLAWK